MFDIRLSDQQGLVPIVTNELIPITSGGRKRGHCSAAPAEQSRLAAALAHEINNPLDCLLNLLYLVQAEPALTENGRQYLMLAEQEVRQISLIVHATLDDFRDPDGPKDTNVPQLVSSVVNFYKPRFESRGISVSTRYCRHGNIPVRAGSLRQVFSNLLLNAADAVPQGGRVQARVSSAHEWLGQRRRGLRVTFADNGCGIPAENLHKIFEPCFTTKGSGGSGLGLSLAKDVVQKNGGSLRVRSSTKPGRSGSIFTIFLPAA
jgi:signal transduction histidine kinase